MEQIEANENDVVFVWVLSSQLQGYGHTLPISSPRYKTS